MDVDGPGLRTSERTCRPGTRGGQTHVRRQYELRGVIGERRLTASGGGTRR